MYKNTGFCNNYAVEYEEMMRNLKFLRYIRFGGAASHPHHHKKNFIHITY